MKELLPSVICALIAIFIGDQIAVHYFNDSGYAFFGWTVGIYAVLYAAWQILRRVLPTRKDRGDDKR